MRVITIIRIVVILLFGTGLANAQNFSAGFSVEVGNIQLGEGKSKNAAAFNVGAGTYINDNIFAGVEFGFGNTRLRGFESDFGKSVVGNQHLRLMTGYKFNQFIQIRVGAGLGGETHYGQSINDYLAEKGYSTGGVNLGGVNGLNVHLMASYKVAVLVGPVELAYTNNGASVGIKFRR